MPRDVVVQPQPPHNPESLVPGTTQGPPMRGLSVGWNKAGWVQIHMYPEGWQTTGDWMIVDLDRSAINRAIRTLRKARDQAYGSDA